MITRPPDGLCVVCDTCRVRGCRTALQTRLTHKRGVPPPSSQARAFAARRGWVTGTEPGPSYQLSSSKRNGTFDMCPACVREAAT